MTKEELSRLKAEYEEFKIIRYPIDNADFYVDALEQYIEELEKNATQLVNVNLQLLNRLEEIAQISNATLDND